MTAPSVWQDGDVAPMFSAGVNNFIAYFDFSNSNDPGTQDVKWHATVSPCDALNAANSKSVVIIVRHGGLDIQSNTTVNGAAILDGDFTYTGGASFNGTIIARQIDLHGDATFSLDQCWIDNMPGPFLQITPTTWNEVDR